MSVSNWIEKTGAIGIVSKAGRYGSIRLYGQTVAGSES